MVVVGVDVHKRSHTFVAVDGAGRKLGELTTATDWKGHAKALRWATERFGSELTWGIEDCRNMSARLEIDLLTAGQSVVRVPPRLMAVQRRTARTPGKSDPIDALAVAWAVQRNPDLPMACHDEASRELKLLVDRREQLVKQRTAAINQLRWHLHLIDPTLDPKPGSLDRAKTRHQLAEMLDGKTGIDARLARELLADIDALTPRIDALATELADLVTQRAPLLLALPGCGALTAAKIVGETAGIGRFRSEACYALYSGTAPIPVWSGETAGRVRLNKSGNRQLNTALHRIAITQVRLDGPGKTYYDKRRAAGDTKTEALRCLKRRLARVVYNTLRDTPSTASQPILPTAA